MKLFELVEELIKIPSISGDEHQVVAFLADYLTKAGFEVETHEVGGNGPNIYARLGDPRVVLSTHTDTVPPFIDFREDNRFIYGRGACDAKGIIAAMVKAAELLKESKVSDFGLLFVVGEEAGSPGALQANSIPNRSRYLINGEPTESKLVLGSKGALRTVIKTSGRAAHSAYPEMGESAIEKLLDILADLRRARLPKDETLGRTTMNIGRIAGGVAANVIPAEAEAEVLFRVVSDTPSLKRIIEDATRDRAIIDYTFACEPVFTQKLEGFETAVVSFTTDIPLLTNWGKPLLFGPGSIVVAHTAQEKIDKQELFTAVLTYRELVLRLQKLSE